MCRREVFASDLINQLHIKASHIDVLTVSYSFKKKGGTILINILLLDQVDKSVS